jgi:hypothetical protein
VIETQLYQQNTGETFPTDQGKRTRKLSPSVHSSGTSMHRSNRSNGFAGAALCAVAPTTLNNKSSANLNKTMPYRKIIAELFTYHFFVAVWRAKEAG